MDSEQIDLGARVAAKIRMAQDALDRASDQLEDSASRKGWSYLTDQVARARGWLADAAEILLEAGNE